MASQNARKSIAALALLAFVSLAVIGAGTGAGTFAPRAIAGNAFADDTSTLPDFDGDGTVGFGDFVKFAAKFGQGRGDDGYDADYDLDNDGSIGFSDFVIFAAAFGKKTTSSNGSPPDDPFARIWGNIASQPWFRESEPYSCTPAAKATSVWTEARLKDLGGADPLSLIRYFGNGSYLRWGFMGFSGCTPTKKYPDSFHQDPPADPTYYSRGELDIWVDIGRVPTDAEGWVADDGNRVDMSMEQAVGLLNQYVAPYYKRVSQNKFRITFRAGNDFKVGGDGKPDDAIQQSYKLVGACLKECEHGAPGGLNRILLSDVATDTGGEAYNGWARFGLASFENANMETIVHEIGHGWMAWPHSYAEVRWEDEPPNPYSNRYDIISGLSLQPILGWDHGMPSTLAINRYAAGWIEPADVALHLADSATYTLSKPLESGYQFLVINSGRPYAFTTLEVLEDFAPKYRDREQVYDPSVAGNYRPRRYEGVLVSRYDQTAGTATAARFGPALYHKDNPDLDDVGWGKDDYSLISRRRTAGHWRRCHRVREQERGRQLGCQRQRWESCGI